MRAILPALALALACGLLVAGSGAAQPGGKPATAGRALPEALEPIRHPLPQQMGPAVREEIAVLAEELEAARTAVAGEEGAASADEAVAELARLYGELGMRYQTYLFFEAAAACYRNASRLAPDEISWVYYTAVLDQEEQRLEEAARGFARVLARRPGDAAARIRASQVELERGELDAAEAGFRRVLEQVPGSAASLHGLAGVAHARGDLAAAEEHLRAALAAQPRADRLHHELALVLRDLGRRDEAKAELAKAGRRGVAFFDPLAAELVSRSVGSKQRAGARALREGKVDQAVELLREARRMDPESTTVLETLAVALAEQGDLDASLETYRLARDLEPERPRSHVNLAQALARRPGGRGEAIVSLRQALELAPEYRLAHLELAGLYAEDEHFADAERHYAIAAELDPQDPLARRGRASALARLERWEEAGRVLEELIAERPDDLAALLDLATVRQREGDAATALELLERVERSPEAEPFARGLAAFNRANFALAAGDLRAAETAYRRAIELAPDLRDAHFNLATVSMRLGDLGTAESAFRAVLALAADDEGATLGLATVLGRRGELAAAKRLLAAAVERRSAPGRIEVAYLRLLASAPDPALRDPSRAVELAGELMRSAPSLPVAEATAIALAAAGRFDEAVRLQEQVLAQARQAGAPPAILERLEEGLAGYRSGRAPVGWP